MKKFKRTSVCAVAAIFSLSIVSLCTFAAFDESAEKPTEVYGYTNTDASMDLCYFLQSEEDIQYFAYLCLEDANSDLKPVIIEARNRIIYRQSWVADDVDGRIYDVNGNVKQELPHFHEIFPRDWDEPVSQTVVDPSYYQGPRH